MREEEPEERETLDELREDPLEDRGEEKLRDEPELREELKLRLEDGRLPLEENSPPDREELRRGVEKVRLEDEFSLGFEKL